MNRKPLLGRKGGGEALDAEVSRLESLQGRVALALELLEAGRTDDARRELEAVLGLDAPEPSLEIDDGELDAALESAVPDPEETVDADRIAQEAMRAADLARPEGVIATSDSPFVTRTVAALLESQGDAEGARAVRSAVQQREPAAAEPEPEPPASRTQVITTLERWLENLRRGRR